MAVAQLVPQDRESDQAFWQWRMQFRSHHPSLQDAYVAGAAHERTVRREPIHAALERFDLSGLHLTGREARVVAALARSENGTLTREEIVREVWGVTVDADDKDSRFHVLRVLVSRARPKLDTRGVCLGTLPSQGYRLHRLDATPCRPNAFSAHGFVPLCLRVAVAV